MLIRSAYSPKALAIRAAFSVCVRNPRRLSFCVKFREGQVARAQHLDRSPGRVCALCRSSSAKIPALTVAPSSSSLFFCQGDRVLVCSGWSAGVASITSSAPITRRGEPFRATCNSTFRATPCVSSDQSSSHWPSRQRTTTTLHLISVTCWQRATRARAVRAEDLEVGHWCRW